MKYILYYCLVLLFCDVCMAVEPTRNEGAQSMLEGTDWLLRYYCDDSEELKSVLPDTRVTVRFADGKLDGSAGCNRYFGGYTANSDHQISIADSIGATQMSCEPPVAEQEHHYLKLLPAVTGYQLADSSLRLLDDDQEVILEYSAIKPLAIENIHWQATGINNGRGGVVSSASTGLATAQFNNGKVSGHAGCNRYNTSYEISDDRITIGLAMTTRRHCTEPDGIMELEQEYLQALGRVRAYELTDTGLKLRDEQGALQVNYVVGEATAR